MSKVKKKRLDMLLVERGISESREKAQREIMAGNIFVDDQRGDKSGTKYKEDAIIEHRGKKMPYVSRGGYKLKEAIDAFNIDLKDKVCLDIGASTGGFTDVMLQGGAKKVFAVDVGYGQLAWKLRIDNKVKVIERCNFRYITKEEIDEKIDFAATDVSFISLTKIIPKATDFFKKESEMVALIKPQFEAGRDKVGKKGVVRDKKVHRDVILKILNFVKKLNLYIYGVDFSPIKGPEGNIEFLVYFGKKDKNIDFNIEKETDFVVENAHIM